MIDKGADVNKISNTYISDKYTPLGALCRFSRDLDAMKLLIDNGADVNIKCTIAAKPISILKLLYHEFNYRSYYSQVKLIVENGADLNDSGQDLIGFLIGLPMIDIQCVQLLIKHGAKIDPNLLSSVSVQRNPQLLTILQSGIEQQEQK